MKIKITKNLPYHSGKLNIPLFLSESDRDKWVENNLLETSISDIDWGESRSFNRTTPTSMTFRVSNKNIENGITRNYAITNIQGKLEYWHISGVYSRNGKTIIYTGIWDEYMNAPDLLSSIRNFKLLSGHSNTDNYNGLTFNGGDRVPVNISTVKRKIENDTSTKMGRQSWIYLYEKTNDTSERFRFISNGVAINTPYKVSIAPLRTLQLSADTEIDNNFIYGTFTSLLDDSDGSSPTRITSHPIGEVIDYTKSVQITAREKENTRNSGWTFYSSYNTFDMYISENKNIQVISSWSSFDFPSTSYTVSDMNYDLNNNIKINNNDFLTDFDEYFDFGYGTEFNNKSKFPFKVYIKNGKIIFEELKVGEFKEWVEKSFLSPEKISLFGQQYNLIGSDKDNLYLTEYGELGDFQSYAFEISAVRQTSFSYFWNSKSIVDKIVSGDNSKVLGSTISDFNPLQFDITEGYPGIDDLPNISFPNDLSKDSAILLEYNYDNQVDYNEYEVILPEINKLENLEGVRKWSLMIENNKEFDIPTKIIENGRFTVKHKFIPTPNETEESIDISGNGEVINLRNDNIWFNSKEIIYGVNAFDTYKANNPVSSKLELFLTPLKAFITGAGLTTWFGGNRLTNMPKKSVEWTDYSYTGPSIEKDMNGNDIFIGGMYEVDRVKDVNDYKKYAKGLGMAAVFGAANAAMAETSLILSRQNMKKKPEEVKGTGSSYNDGVFNNLGFVLTLVEWEYQTAERDGVVKGIYKSGVGYDNYIVDSFENIKRPRFNSISIENMYEVIPENYYEKYSIEQIEMIANFYLYNRRYWSDRKNFLKFDLENLGDNGD